MALNDDATLAVLDAAREVFKTCIAEQGGRVIDMAGDSVLAVFDTALGAVRAAMGIQAQLSVLTQHTPADQRMQFRIGVHLGDVIEKTDGTVYGDGVNVAARLQTLAEPGSIVVSQAIEGALGRRAQAGFVDLGEHSVKNIANQCVHLLVSRRQAKAGTSPHRRVPARRPHLPRRRYLRQEDWLTPDSRPRC